MEVPTQSRGSKIIICFRWSEWVLSILILWMIMWVTNQTLQPNQPSEENWQIWHTIEGTKSNKPLTFCMFIASIYDEQYTRWIEAHYVSLHLLNQETTHDIAAYTVWRKQTETLDEMHRNTSLTIMVVTDSNIIVKPRGDRWHRNLHCLKKPSKLIWWRMLYNY